MHPVRRAAAALSAAAALAAVALPAAAQQSPRPAAPARSYPAESLHLTLVAHVPMTSGGEGYAEKAAGGKRYLYVAHESGPHCFSIVDVTDAAAPRMLRTVETAAKPVRCNSLDVNGNLLAVAAETTPGGPAGGVRLYTLNDPANPRLVAYFDTSGPHSHGAHHVWFSSEKLLHVTAGANDFTPGPGRPRDDQFYRILDVSNPAQPHEVGRWWYPGQRAGDPGAPLRPVPQPEEGTDAYRPHNIDVFPQRPNRAYMGYLDGGIVILDIADVAHPKPVSIVDYVGPFTHTAWPIFSRNLLAVSEEDVGNGCIDEPKRVSIWDIADETKPRLLSTVPYPADSWDLCKRGGRMGPHNIYENKPYGPTYKSDRWLFTSWFGGGVRIYDLADPSHPKEAAYYVPATPADSPMHAPQINDLFVDDRGVIFAGDRFTGGLFVLRSDLIAP